MPFYLDIARKEQCLLIQGAKRKSNLSWRRIWEELGVCRSMMYFYRKGKCRIPREKLEKLLQLSSVAVDTNSFTFVNNNYSLQKAVISTMCEKMAEFLGVLFGDGCLFRSKFRIDVSGDSKSDYLYHLFHVQSLFKSLFELDTKFSFEKNSQEMHTFLYSKMVHAHLSKEFSFPIGHKKGHMIIPPQIYLSDVYKRAFLRGLFDTDGGVHRHHKTSIQIQYTSADGVFQKQVQELLVNFGFTARINGWDIQIRGKNEIDRFFNEIKPANPKHLYKYKKFKETGVVPLHREIDYSSLNKGFILST